MGLKRILEKELEGIVENLTFHPFERLCYSCDFSPLFLRRLVRSVPDVVVRPKNAEELRNILKYASLHRIPVVPRGGGTSALFGSVPKKGGILLDLTGLASVIEIDPQRRYVETETGITFFELDRVLRKKGMTLLSYPSSALAATIGGWMATSGYGIGSLKYGHFFDHLISVEVIFPDGSIRRLEGKEEFEPLLGTEGMLAVFIKASFEIRPLPEATFYSLLYFEREDEFFEFIETFSNENNTPFTIEFFDQNYLRLSGNRFCGEKGAVLIAYEGEREEIEEAKNSLELLKNLYKIRIEDGKRKWEERFKGFAIRRNLPGIVPFSFYLPVRGMKDFYYELFKLKRSFALQGYLISRTEAVVIPQFVYNEEGLSYCLFSLSLNKKTFQKAIVFGGRPTGGIGLWNAPFSEEILSKERISEIKKQKKVLDPFGILNPSMWLNPPFFMRTFFYNIAFRIASFLENFLPEEKGSKTEEEIKRCIQCGNCINSCPTKKIWLSTTPKGRIFYTKIGFGKWKEEYLDSLFSCSLCGRCKEDCPQEIDFPSIWIKLRTNLRRKGIEPQRLKGFVELIERTKNVVGKNNEERMGWQKKMRFEKEIRKERAPILYFVGCVTAFYPMVNDIARSFVQFLVDRDLDFIILGGEEWCCGYPLVSAGYEDKALCFMEHNIEEALKRDVNTVLLSCPGCYRMWRSYVEKFGINLRILHTTQFITELLNKLSFNELDLSVTYHDPCDLGRISQLYDEPRLILKSIPSLKLIELEKNREYCSCCGSGGNLLFFKESLSMEIAKRKIEEVKSAGVKTVVTACPSCIRAMNMAKILEHERIEIFDITQLVFRTTKKS